MRGAFMGPSQSRRCSGMKTLKRCKNNGEADNVVLIDVDGDNFDNVIILDVPESFTKKVGCSSGMRKDKKIPLQTYIYIDDDESPENHDPEKGDGNCDGGASSSMKFGSASNHPRHIVDAVGDEYHFAQENTSPLKLSKGKRTYSGKASNNRYSFSTDSDSDSSDNDGPDCEFMEDSSGQLREEWEKAFLKRKSEVCNAPSCRREQGSASRLPTDGYQDVGVRKKTERQTKPSVCSNGRKSSNEKEDQTPSVATVDGSTGSTSSDPKKSPLADTDLNLTQKTQMHHKNADIQAQGEPLMEDPSCCNDEQQTHKHFEHGGSGFINEEGQNYQGSPLFSYSRRGDKQVNDQHESRIPQTEPRPSTSDPSDDVNVSPSKASVSFGEASWCRFQCSVETEIVHGHVVSEDIDEESEKAPCTSNPQFSSKFELKKCKQSEQSEFSLMKELDSQQSDETHMNSGVSPSNEGIGVVPGENFSAKCPSGKPGIRDYKNFTQEKGERVPQKPSLGNIHFNEARFNRECLGEGDEACLESVSNYQEEDEKNHPLHAPDGDTSPVGTCLINEREKLKETDEYKRAVEEEWSSRQRALQIQAEEAQLLKRLRKRRKAESLRLLDMEKRQKQRVEEIRETQKKDEENMNLKEQHRAEVRKELKKLETTCRDMASLLRGLGIQVGSGLNPSPQEVRAAYKRALLSFHPDRASGSDMRQQVEAEEKFKLISRMKDKFLRTS